ncbi:hypothetical protein [Novosphingobium pentaromativorans]|uniref:hypothetical protein n=1 Tax=Novosphingobium pentaromativorans TaxID=205844 RepID=UPI000AB0A12C|nr:hypothetical protein [Novosphingobium pentaromativorans]
MGKKEATATMAELASKWQKFRESAWLGVRNLSRMRLIIVSPQWGVRAMKLKLRQRHHPITLPHIELRLRDHRHDRRL